MKTLRLAYALQSRSPQKKSAPDAVPGPKTDQPGSAGPESTPSEPIVERRALSTDERSLAEQVRIAALKLSVALDRVLYQAYFLDRIWALFLTEPHSDFAEVTQNDWEDSFEYVNGRIYEVETNVYKIQQNANLLIGIIGGFVLPILFGLAGAVTFVIRGISNQIQTSTFSNNSPIRHLMRVSLGAFAGIVVGLFTTITNTLSLPPLAIAFLAGYGVEALFSTFDDLIQRFKKT